MFLTETIKSETVVAKIFREIHIVKDLKANILLGMNILILKEVIIDLLSQTLKLTKVKEIEIPIQIETKNNVNVNHIIRVEKQTVVSLKSVGQVLIQLAEKHQVLSNHDFLFKSQKDSVYTHFVNSDFHTVQVQMDSSESLRFSRNEQIEKIVKYKDKECYHIDTENHELITKSTIKMKLSTASISQNLTSKKYKMKNRITIYEDKKISGALQEVVMKYLTLWELSDTVIDLSEELDLKILLITD